MPVLTTTTVAKVCRHRDAILDAAAVYEVESVHMFSCLLSEYTFLKDGTDDWVDVAAALGIYDDPSLGMAQIKLSTGRGLAKRIYKDQKGPISDKKIIADLLNPARAPLYMALLIREIIQDYADAGFDISRYPGLVCSSYLVGQSRRRAQRHRREGTSPRLNRYGLFAQQNMSKAAAIKSGSACPRPQ